MFPGIRVQSPVARRCPFRWKSSFPLECRAVPAAQGRASFIRALQEVKQCLLRIGCKSHVLIHQDVFAESIIVFCGRRQNACIAESLWLRSGVGVEGGIVHGSATWPEASADDFMGIRFPRHRVGARTLGRASSRKTRAAKIEAAPKEMYRTALADKTSAKFL